MSLCGPAFTVHCPPFSNLQIHHALYHAEPGDILVVHVGGGVEAGYWGDILNEAALARGLGGLVIDGGVRDTAGLAAAAFPVFSNGVCIQGTGKDLEAVAWLQQPVRIGAVTITPGDLVMGDRDGGGGDPRRCRRGRGGRRRRPRGRRAAQDRGHPGRRSHPGPVRFRRRRALSDRAGQAVPRTRVLNGKSMDANGRRFARC